MTNQNIIPALFLTAVVTAFSAKAQFATNVNPDDYGVVKTNIGVNYDYGWGEIKDAFSARVSYELIRKKHFTLTANARYSSVKADFDTDDLSDGFSPDVTGLNGTHIMGQTGLTTTFNTRLGGKTIVGMALANGEWGEGGFARVSGIVMAMIMLRADRDTQFGIGPLVLINSCSRIPAFPVFIYRHRFNEKWLLNLYGGIFGINYTPTRNDLFDIGADVDVKSFYFKPGNEKLPERCRFSSASIRPMIKYKRRLLPHLYFDIEGGASIKMTSHVNGMTGSHKYIKCNRKTAPFIQTGISYSL